MIYAYKRVSDKKQTMDLQTDSIAKHKCDKVFNEKKSAGKILPERNKMLALLEPGDTVMVWALDRIGRSFREIVNIVYEITEKKVVLVSLKEGINTSTSVGRHFVNLMAIFAEMERERIRDRTIAGLEAAKARGRIGGRPTGLSTDGEKTKAYVKQLYEKGTDSIKDICAKAGISRTTFYKYNSK